MIPELARLLILVLAGALTTSCAAWSYLGYRIAPDYPVDETRTLDLPGFDSEVRVTFDDLGVPHVEADNEVDLLRAAGFLHGRSRFFQMDTLRRYARGRLSELVGEQRLPLGSTVELDLSMRSWGFDRASQAEADALDAESRRLMTAYVAGVNEALRLHPPIEYRLLGVEPEPWTIADSFAVGSIIAWGITHNWRHEVCRLLLALHVGWERAERIFPPDPWPGGTSLQADGERRPLPPSVVPEIREIFPARAGAEDEPATQASGRLSALELPELEGASNGWVVGGGRTVSGKPMVANDPHLPHMLPSIVMQQHLKNPGFEVIGATVPGLPYVLLGHNRKVAWGFTSAVADVLDLYIEKENPNRAGEVVGPEGPEPIESETVVIRIRDGSEFRQKTAQVRRTRRGPVLNDMYPGLLPEGAPIVSVRGIPLGAGSSIRGLRQAGRATNVRELREALMGIASPINTVLAADVDGEIALFATGSVPVRRHHRGTFAVPAWLPDYQWSEMATPGQMPAAFGSERDLFAHTNNLMHDPERSPFIFQVDSAPSYRRDRAVELLQATEKHTVDSYVRIQGDTLVLRAKRVLPAMLEDLRGLEGFMPREEPSIRLLSSWDFHAEADSAATAIFFVTYREIIKEALRDEIDEKGLAYLMKFRYFTSAVDSWFDEPDHPVWDDRSTPGLERRADVVRTAFRRSIVWFRENLGGEGPDSWHWGKLHDMHMKHTFGTKIEAFNLPPRGMPGALASVWKAHFDLGNAEHPFRNNYGPVYRMVVDLADVEHAWWILDSGSSGWPLSPHYGDQHERWQNLEFAPMLMNWDEIRAAARGVLTLK